MIKKLGWRAVRPAGGRGDGKRCTPTASDGARARERAGVYAAPKTEVSRCGAGRLRERVLRRPRMRLQRRWVSMMSRLRERPAITCSLNLIAAASQEAQTLFEMSQSLGVSLSLNETVSVMASRLHRLIPFDSCALYLKVGDMLGAALCRWRECQVVYNAMLIATGRRYFRLGGTKRQAALEWRRGPRKELQEQVRLQRRAAGRAFHSAGRASSRRCFGALTLYSMTADGFRPGSPADSACDEL